MKVLLSLVLCLVAVVAAFATDGSQKSYEGYQLLSVRITSREELALIESLELQRDGVDLWSATVNSDALILVSPENRSVIIGKLLAAGLQVKVVHTDFQSVLASERRQLAERSLHRRLSERDANSWVGNDFVRYAEITAWIESMKDGCGDMCSFTTIGKSSEGRDIYVVTVGKRSGEESKKPIIMIESNIHAREWLSSAATIYTINNLLTQYSSNNRIRKALDDFEWHFIPLANPDGYEYSWEKDRLWRKNRSRQSSDQHDSCLGVDVNRNFGHHGGPGTSSDQCWLTYCGPEPFSENETKAIRDYATARKNRIAAYFSVHTYGQFILLPLGFEQNGPRTEDYDELMRVGELMSKAMFTVSSATYTVGNVAEVLYPAAGTSLDWAKEELKIKYVYSAELQPRLEAPGNGFVVSPKQIVTAGRELSEALLVLSENLSA